jgi:putative membrane protein
MMGNGLGMGGMGWLWLFGLLLLVVGIGVLVVLAVRLWRGGVDRGTGPGASGPPRLDGRPPAHGRARDVLDERYARGELTTEEYRERLQALNEGT